MDCAGVAITNTVFPLLPIQKHLFDEPGWKTKLRKAMKSWQGSRNIKWKKSECQIGLVWPLEGKAGWCPELRYLQEPWRRVSDCRSHSKDQAEPAGSKCFQAQLVQNNHLSLGELYFALTALHAASLMENYSAHEDLSPWLQPCSDTHTHRTNYRRQNIHHVRKKRIKRSFLKLHQLVQLASSHSLPYKAVPTPHHAR